MQQLLSVKEFAALKAISEVTVRRQIKSGAIKVERFGRAVRIVPASSDSNSYKPIPSYLHQE